MMLFISACSSVDGSEWHYLLREKDSSFNIMQAVREDYCRKCNCLGRSCRDDDVGRSPKPSPSPTTPAPTAPPVVPITPATQAPSPVVTAGGNGGDGGVVSQQSLTNQIGLGNSGKPAHLRLLPAMYSQAVCTTVVYIYWVLKIHSPHLPSVSTCSDHHADGKCQRRYWWCRK